MEDSNLENNIAYKIMLKWYFIRDIFMTGIKKHVPYTDSPVKKKIPTFITFLRTGSEIPNNEKNAE